MENKNFCPVNGWDCPYWRKDGHCAMEHPEEECEDFIAIDEFFADLGGISAN